MSISKTSFTRNLRGYLNAARISGAFSAGRIARTTKSLSDSPIEPIDAIFSVLPDNYESPGYLAGFKSVTQHLLASNVLDNLLQIQNEMSSLDEQDIVESESLSSKAARAYRRSQENFPLPPSATIYYFGS